MWIVFAGLAAGLAHVVGGPDHVAAVAPLAVRDERRAWSAGARWGFGHAAGVVAVGIAALLAREALPLEWISSVGERLVGLTLIAIGLWSLLRAVRERRMARALDDARSAAHAAFAVGTLHGIAGSSHLFGVLPALALPTRSDACLYLAAFALGTIAAMAAVAGAFGRLGRGEGRVRWLGATAVASIAVGVYWTAAA